MDEIAQIAALADMQSGRTKPGLLPATFLIEAVYNDKKSKEEGRAIYVDTEVVEIRVGADIIRRHVTDKDRHDYAAQYKAWKDGENQEAVEGYPLSEWAALPGKALVKELAHYGLRTVEQLANAPDTLIQKIGPYAQYKHKAKDWVADAEKRAPLVKLRDENESLKQRLSALEMMVSRQSKEIEAARSNGGTLPAAAATPDLSAIIAEQVAKAVAAAVPPPKKRGRPPKIRPAESEEQ